MVVSGDGGRVDVHKRDRVVDQNGKAATTASMTIFPYDGIVSERRRIGAWTEHSFLDACDSD